MSDANTKCEERIVGELASEMYELCGDPAAGMAVTHVDVMDRREPQATMVNHLVGRFGLSAGSDTEAGRVWSGSGVSPCYSEPDEGLDRVRLALLGAHYNEPPAWMQWPYRVVWRIPSLWMHVTYCEGDVIVIAAASAERFERLEKGADEFYGARSGSVSA